MSFATRDAPVRQKTGKPSSLIGQAAIRQNAVSEEALSRLLTLNIGELRQQWRGVYKTQVPLTSVASCWCELSHTACRNSLWVASAQSRDASCSGLHCSSSKPDKPRYALARS
jgi:hypothetical protein